MQDVGAPNNGDPSEGPVDYDGPEDNGPDERSYDKRSYDKRLYDDGPEDDGPDNPPNLDGNRILFPNDIGSFVDGGLVVGEHDNGLTYESINNELDDDKTKDDGSEDNNNPSDVDGLYDVGS